MFWFWKAWMDATEFGLQAQRVIALCLIKLSAGGPAGKAECKRMVTEKLAAAAAAQTAGVIALARGKPIGAAAKLALAPVKHRVRTNHRRLSPR